MLDKFHDIIKSDFTDPGQCDFLLAVSGGRDSMVLATFFQKLELKFQILHCHFGLRPEAYKETQLVIQWCVRNQKKARIAYFPTSDLLSKGESPQAVCRNLRYRWFKEMKSQYGDGVLVTAHHADDERETFFINLVRGSGITGLGGMHSNPAKIYRPLLTFTQAEISHFAEANDLPFIHDASNFDNDYLRNKLRNKVLPKFKNLDRNAYKGIGNSIENLKDAGLYIEGQLKVYISKLVTTEKDGIRIIQVSEWPPFLLKTYLARIGFSRDVINDLFQNIQGEGRTFKSKNYELLTRKDEFYLIENSEYDVYLEIEKYGVYDLNDDRTLTITKTNMPENYNSLRVDSKVVLDVQNLNFPLLLRNWRPGDKMKPLGMQGKSKKVQDILTDAKVNKLDKRRVLLAEDSSGLIFWLIGHHISHDVRITEKSETLISFSLEHHPT